MSGRPPDFVLDSYAVLGYLEGEASQPRVVQLLEDAAAGRCSVFLSLINLGEVLYIAERERGRIAAVRTLAAIEQLPIEISPASRETVFAAAHIKARYAISYADAFAVAEAMERRCTLLTGDPEFRKIADAGLVAIEWLPHE